VDRRRPETSQVRIAHNLVGVTVTERTRSEDIREQLKMKGFDENVREYQKKRVQHPEKTDNNRAPKIIMNYKPVGLRILRRPRSGWQDQIRISERALFRNLD
jgi:hypothetical protein